jgi:hypothetical protein
MPGWLPDAELQEAVAGSLHRDWADLAPAWLRVTLDANEAAYRDLRRLLGGAGYSQAQVDAWPDAADAQKTLALLEALERGGGLEEVERELLTYLQKRRDELTKGLLVLDADGAVVTPEFGGRVGRGETGRMPSVFLDPRRPRVVALGRPEWADKFRPW